jgi:hypothetical protein
MTDGETKPKKRKGRPQKMRAREADLTGFKFFDRLQDLLEVLQSEDPHHNRKLHYHEYALAMTFFYLNPALNSLRGLQQATELPKVQKALGIRRMSLGSMSESVRMFDPALLAKVFEKLACEAPERTLDMRLKGLEQVLTIVDGTLLRALPRMVWALWLGETDRAVKIHTQFEVAKDTPVGIGVTTGNGSETEYLQKNLRPKRLYALDRGYANYSLLQSILEAKSSFVVRVKDNVCYETIEEREVTAEAKEAGVASDQEIRIGSKKHHVIDRNLRLIEVRVPGGQDSRSLGYRRKKVHSSVKSIRIEQGQPYTLYLVTDRLDLPADVVALIYQHRWKVELFFRLFKSLLGCRHLLSDSIEGITIQVYSALIASLLLAEHTGIRPTKRTFELLTFYLSGWLDDDELIERLAKLKKAQAPK